MANDVNVNIDAPQVDAPVSVSFGGIFTDFKNAVDNLVEDVKGGSATAMTGVFLAAMFVVAGVYVWRRV